VHYWLGDGLSAGRKRIDRWLTGLGDRLVAVDVDGTTAYVVADDLDALVASRPSRAVRFLPGHDQWVIGPGTKDTRVTPAAHRDLMTRKANPVVVGGVVSGTWSVRGDELTVTWLEDGRRPRTAVEEEAARMGDILGVDLRLTWAP
jgi:Winged helix DNA-binding domain